MKNILNGVQCIFNLGAPIVFPIVIIILGSIFKIELKKSLKSGITIGIGFVGINLVVELLVNTLGPVAQEIVERFGLSLTVIDIGWSTTAAAAWASPVTPILIPTCLAVNLILIYFKKTKTLNLDIWNYWHFIVTGAIGYIVTGNYIWAIICTVIMEVAVLFVADKTAKNVNEFWGLDGISLPTGSTISFVPLGYIIGKIIEKIPWIGSIKADTTTIQKKMGVFGEPMIIGVLLGLILSLLAGYELPEVLNTAISMGAVMLLMPRMVKILMEGLMPISKSIKNFSKDKYGDRELYIGLDASITVGHPAVMSTALILVPITLFLAVILPGNRVIPFGDLATIPFYVAFIVCFRKGNIVHSVIVGSILISISLYMATNFAPVHTLLITNAKLSTLDHKAMFSSLDVGGNLFKWIILKLSQLVNQLGIFV